MPRALTARPGCDVTFSEGVDRTPNPLTEVVCAGGPFDGTTAAATTALWQAFRLFKRSSTSEQVWHGYAHDAGALVAAYIGPHRSTGPGAFEAIL